MSKTSSRPDAQAPPSGRGWRPALYAGLGLLIVLQLALLVALVRTNNQISDDVSALRDDVDGLQALGSVPVLGSDEVADLGSGPAAAGNQSPAPAGGPASADPGGDLPRFQAGVADPALGRGLGQLTSVEYYSGENAVLDPADGVARAYMVWAHWCPFCQEELPQMAEWQLANADTFENFELVSVTTAMDATAANPLIPYLDQNQFPFAVLVDDDGSLSRQLGVNAFPFWVFTGPDGTVVGRAAGLIETDDLSTVVEELVQLSASA